MENHGVVSPPPYSDYRPSPGTLQDGGWFWLEGEAAERIGRELGAYALAVYTVLARRANSESRRCWPGYVRIAEDLRCSKDTVERAVAKLAAHGFIRVEQRFTDRVRIKKRRAANGITEEVIERRRENDTNLYTIIDRCSVGAAAGSGYGSRPTGAPSPQPAATAAALGDANQTNSNRRNESDEMTSSSAAHATGETERQGERPAELFAAFCRGLGVDAAYYDAATRNRWSRELAKLGAVYDADDIARFVAFKRSNPFFRDRSVIKPRHVREELPAWMADGCPRWHDQYVPSEDERDAASAEDLPGLLEDTRERLAAGEGNESDHSFAEWASQRLQELHAKGYAVDSSDDEEGDDEVVRLRAAVERTPSALRVSFKRQLLEAEEEWEQGLRTRRQAGVIAFLRGLTGMPCEDLVIPGEEIEEHNAELEASPGPLDPDFELPGPIELVWEKVPVASGVGARP